MLDTLHFDMKTVDSENNYVHATVWFKEEK